MKKTYYLKIILCLYFLLSSIPFLKAQDTNNANNRLSKSSYAEKIYLQLSNTVFTTSETLWFKAIVTNSINKPSNISGVLYVDLIDFDEHIIDTKILKLENGLSDGFFDLSKLVTSGRYLIRAYTTWNRNFSQAFVYETYIDVFALDAINKGDVITNVILTETEADHIKLSASLFPEIMKAEYNKDLKVYIESEGLLDSIEVKRKNE